MCVMACSYGAITPVDTALKCDLCPDRAARDGRARFACVEACPTEALVAGTFEQFRKLLAQPVEWLSLQQSADPA
jgi:Fe-S-cluster-containing dehydrogenase component